MKKGFKKYAYEDIRTDYFSLTTAATEGQSKVAGTIIAVTITPASGDNPETRVLTTDPTTITAANLNKTQFLLAEDIKVGDSGFVYYIVEDSNNLEDRV